MRVAFLGNSIPTHNNGAALHSVPELLSSLIRAGGVLDWTIDSFCVPGQTWATAHKAVTTWDGRMVALIGGRLTPVDAMKLQPRYDLILVCDGYNDRANPNAQRDYEEFRNSLLGFPVAYVAQRCLLPDGSVSSKGLCTAPEAWAMENLYATIPDKFYGASLAKLYEMGFTYDGTHLTNSGKEWFAASIYMGLQADYDLTPINRNTAWLYDHPELWDQMRKANT